jgi:hypothetical protein
VEFLDGNGNPISLTKLNTNRLMKKIFYRGAVYCAPTCLESTGVFKAPNVNVLQPPLAHPPGPKA